VMGDDGGSYTPALGVASAAALMVRAGTRVAAAAVDMSARGQQRRGRPTKVVTNVSRAAAASGEDEQRARSPASRRGQAAVVPLQHPHGTSPDVSRGARCKASTRVRVAVQPLCTHGRALRTAAQSLAGRPPPHSPPTPAPRRPPPPSACHVGRLLPGAASGPRRCAPALARVGYPDPFKLCHAVDDNVRSLDGRGAPHFLPVLAPRRSRSLRVAPRAPCRGGDRTGRGRAETPPARGRPTVPPRHRRRRPTGSREGERRAVRGAPSWTRLGTRGRRS